LRRLADAHGFFYCSFDKIFSRPLQFLPKSKLVRSYQSRTLSVPLLAARACAILSLGRMNFTTAVLSEG
jgi:hypothetical protein